MNDTFATFSALLLIGDMGGFRIALSLTRKWPPVIIQMAMF